MSCPFIRHPLRKLGSEFSTDVHHFLLGIQFSWLPFIAARQVNWILRGLPLLYSDSHSCSSARSSRFGAWVQYLWLNIINSCYFVLLRIMYTLWLLMCQAFLQHREQNFIIYLCFKGQHKAIHFSQGRKKKEKKEAGHILWEMSYKLLLYFCFSVFF